MDFETTTIRSWEELISKQRPFAMFRGQADAYWNLSTSLERACILNDGNLDNAPHREERLLLSFKRHYHEFTQDIPAMRDDLRWLAIMQHHGAPTRLMDWTYSVLVAAYFAVENAIADAAVWEIDTEWLDSTAKEHLLANGIEGTSLSVHLGHVSQDDAAQRFKEQYLSNEWRLVQIMSPYFRDRRLIAQQGMFACPGDISVPFMNNLVGMRESHAHVKKYVIPLDLRQQILYQLFCANIGRFTLFPGLDGFANTLRIYHPLIWGMESGTTAEAPPEST